MLYPTINKLTENGKYNRYQLAIATSKCARIITDEYTAQRKTAEKNATGNKDVDRSQAEMIVNSDYRDKKAVKIAIDKMDEGEYVIVNHDEDGMNTEGTMPKAD